MSGQGKCIELVAKAAEKNRYAKMVNDNMEACTPVEHPARARSRYSLRTLQVLSPHVMDSQGRSRTAYVPGL